MVRAIKPSQHIRTCYSPCVIELDDEVIRNLCVFLGIETISTKSGEMTQCVEEVLGCYSGMVETLDNAPTHASVRKALKPLQKQAQKLWQDINVLDMASKSWLDNVDYEGLTPLLDRLIDFDVAASEVCNAKIESRGQPKKKSL